jgi:hypothetical protein
MEAILLDIMFDLPSLEGINEVMISRQVVEGAAGPLYMYAARAGGAKATFKRAPLCGALFVAVPRKSIVSMTATDAIQSML